MSSNITLKKFGRIVAILLTVLLVSSVVLLPVAAQSFNTEAEDHYNFWKDEQDYHTSAMYNLKKVIDGEELGIGSFAAPHDIYTDKNGYVYIADTDNGRVVVLDSDFKYKTQLKNLSYEGETLDMEGLQGVYVRDNGDIYICDTEHQRVVICNLDGTVKGTLGLPPADVIPNDFSYRPTRIVIDSDGITYVVSEGSYYGAIMYDVKGNFSGFFGSNSVEGSILTALSKIWELIFHNDTKKAQKERELPYQFTDITMDDNNFVYTATGASTESANNKGQIKKLSPGGTNILKDKTKRMVTAADSKDFSDGADVRYAITGSYNVRKTDLSSMDVDNEGYMYALCSAYGHVFIYDQECNRLGVFGGGASEGYQDGTFYYATSIQYNRLNDDILICDKLANRVTVYSQTEFGALIKKAQKLTTTGAYVEAKPYWEKVISMDRGCKLAYSGLAKAAFMEEDYKQAMEYALNGEDQETYANAYSYVRNEDLSQNFIWIFLVAIAVVGVLAAFLIYTNKKQVTLIKNEKVRIMFNSLVHPFESANKIKYENKGSLLLATILLVLYYIVTVLNDMHTGFMHKIFDKSDYNSILVVLSTVVLMGLYATVNWAMSTLFEGKGSLKECYIITCYSLIPLIINLALQTVLSNFLTPEENLIMNVIAVVCTALFLIFMCVGMMTIHEFGLFKLVGITLITLFGMLVVIFIAFMVGILVAQMVTFIVTIIKELSYR